MRTNLPWELVEQVIPIARANNVVSIKLQSRSKSGYTTNLGKRKRDPSQVTVSKQSRRPDWSERYSFILEFTHSLIHSLIHSLTLSFKLDLQCNVFDVSPSDIIACSNYVFTGGDAMISILDSISTNPNKTGMYNVSGTNFELRNSRPCKFS